MGLPLLRRAVALLAAAASVTRSTGAQSYEEPLVGTPHRQVDRSQQGDHETYRDQRARVAQAVGDYKFYVYAGSAFDAMTSDLLKGLKGEVADVYHLAEDSVELWTHRSLLAHPRRTRDPAEADLFFVPAYLTLSTTRAFKASHRARLGAMLGELTDGAYFRRNAGRDHVFGYSSTNPGVARGLGFGDVAAAMNQSFFGTFEMNPAWVGAKHPTPREVAMNRRDLVLNRMIPMPYVVDADELAGPPEHRKADIHHHEISVFFAANGRPSATKWSGCDRSKALGLKGLPKASIHVRAPRQGPGGPGRARRLQHVVEESKFAHAMRVSDFCLVMCGDTPTSRRIFDSIVADCVPLVVGTRLFGHCDPPCHKERRRPDGLHRKSEWQRALACHYKIF